MTMQIWKDGRFQPDPWRYIEEGEDVRPAGRVILPLEWWQSQRAIFAGSAAEIGVRLEPAEDPAALADDLDRLALIVLQFPTFADGRAFSMAAALRERLGYRGLLRAAGDVLIDQIQLMERCGFDEFEIGDPATARALAAATVPRQTLFYQSAEGDAAAGGYAWRRRIASALDAENGRNDRRKPEHQPILTSHWG